MMTDLATAELREDNAQPGRFFLRGMPTLTVEGVAPDSWVVRLGGEWVADEPTQARALAVMARYSPCECCGLASTLVVGGLCAHCEKEAKRAQARAEVELECLQACAERAAARAALAKRILRSNDADSALELATMLLG